MAPLTRMLTLKKFIPRMQMRSLSTSTNLESDYLHKSILPSYHFQNCLPRLPIPKLEDTMRRYVTSLEALEGHPEISAHDIESTKRGVYSFLQSEGQRLNKILIDTDNANQHTNYISKPWFDMYLESRLPLPLNYNPFMVINRDANEALNNQLVRSTNLIISTLRFYKTLKDEVLMPEVFYTKQTAKSPLVQNMVKFLPNAFNLRYMPMYLSGAYPLDMSQYGNLFSSTRIPGVGRDRLRTFPKSKHLVVLRNGHFYTFDVLDENNNILPVENIMQNLKSILEDKVAKPQHELAYLSSEDRDTWANAREHLLQSGNVTQIGSIDSAIFCLVLEDQNCDVTNIDQTTSMFLYGDGGSRWYDKSFSLVVAKNGETAINFEHAWGDGVAVVRYMNEIYDDTINNPRVTSPDFIETTPKVQRLEFNLDDQAKSTIENAKARYIADTGRLKVAGQKYDKMSKEYLKAKKISPDGVLQLAIQIAHRRMYGYPAPTYESSSTSAFKHGRTETVRSCTVEAQAVAKYITEKGLNDTTNLSELNTLIRESCKKHNSLTFEGAMGLGFDRHMFGLKYTAAQTMGKLPNIFEDHVYKVMNHIILSTSTLDTNSIAVGGFAPVVPDGFGIGYGCRIDHLGCNITSYEKDVQKFVDTIMESFDNIRTVLESQ
uniref:carnitine O-palmitoyltransferase 2, mitochondrial-like n=1 Tax=Styela clava TaxID=7725 RepID=UPI00193A3360|nr:carnitine O-palmitoyltransferase 2, mitochondrial-like [Styela clava]